MSREDLAAFVEQVMAEHGIDLGGLRRDLNVKAGYWIRCDCGWEWSPDRDVTGDQHRTHVAAKIAKALDGDSA